VCDLETSRIGAAYIYIYIYIYDISSLRVNFEALKALGILWVLTACSSQIGTNVLEVLAAYSSYTKA